MKCSLSVKSLILKHRETNNLNCSEYREQLTKLWWPNLDNLTHLGRINLSLRMAIIRMAFRNICEAYSWLFIYMNIHPTLNSMIPVQLGPFCIRKSMEHELRNNTINSISLCFMFQVSVLLEFLFWHTIKKDCNL